MLGVQNEFFDGSEAHNTKSGFTNPYLAKKFKWEKLTDPVKMIREDRTKTEF